MTAHWTPQQQRALKETCTQDVEPIDLAIEPLAVIGSEPPPPLLPAPESLEKRLAASECGRLRIF